MLPFQVVVGTDLGGLIAYDLKILRKGARAAFSSKRDLPSGDSFQSHNLGS